MADLARRPAGYALVNPYAERIGAILLLLLALIPRLLMITRFPTRPISDFASLMNFGIFLRDHGLSHDAWFFWQGLNIGMPLALSGIFTVLPCQDAATVARWATALMGAMPAVVPFLLWRGVLSWRIRFIAGAALALWPGQVFFSGVVAQDNWVILPSVIVAALAVRGLLDADRALPVVAALAYAAAGAMKADAFVMLLPVLLAAVRIDRFRVERRRMIVAGFTLIAALFSLALIRYLGSGRFSLSPEHTGITMLGAYLPGSATNGWVPPYAYIAAVRPELLKDRHAMLAQASGLALQAALRRPAFHAARIAAGLLDVAGIGEVASLLWSVQSPDVLPEALRTRGVALFNAALIPLHLELVLIHALFLCALLLAWRLRNLPVLALASCVILKYFFHAFGVMQGRYFLVATAIELLAIVLAAPLVPKAPAERRRLLPPILGAGLAAGLFLYFATPPLEAAVQRHDVAPVEQRSYRFHLDTLDTNASLECTVNQGELTVLWPPDSATLRTLHHDPIPGENAVAACDLTATGAPAPVFFELNDNYAATGRPGRMLQRVEVDGAQVYSNDVGGDDFSGWADVPLGAVGPGTVRKVVLEVRAVQPDPGSAWGDAAATDFRLTRTPVDPNSRRRASQSSTYTTSPVARLAIDGNTDGNFFHNSVTHTTEETNPWWQLDLGAATPIQQIVIWNRTDCCMDRLSDFWVFVSDTPFSPTDTPASLKSRPGTWSSHQTAVPKPSVTLSPKELHGRYVRVQLEGRGFLSLAEVQVSSK